MTLTSIAGQVSGGRGLQTPLRADAAPTLPRLSEHAHISALRSIDARWTFAVAAVVFAVSFFNGSQSVAAIAGVTAVAWWAAGLALVRSAGSIRIDRVARWAIAGLGAYAALQIASLAWASDQGLVLIEVCRTLGYLGLLVAVVVGVAPPRVRPVLVGLALGLLAVSALALGARLFPGILEGDQIRLAQFSGSGGRLGYPVAYWNGLGAQMAMLSLASVWIGSTGPGVRSRALAIAALPMPLLTLYLTGSRGGLLALMVGVVVIVALSPVRSRLLGGLALGGIAALIPVVVVSGETAVLEGAGDQAARDAGVLVAILLVAAMAGAGLLRRRLDRRLGRPWAPSFLRGPRPVVALLLAGVVVFLVVGGPDRVAQFDQTDATPQEGRGQLTGRFFEAGSRERVLLWETAIDALEAEPVHGVGAGAFTYFSNQNDKVGRPVRDAHSLYFESLAELGPLGLVAVLVFLGSAAVAVAKRTFGDHDGVVAACGAILAAAMVGIGLDWLWEIPAVMAPVVAVVGLLVGRATAETHSPPAVEAGDLPRSPGPITLALTSIVGVLAVSLALSLILGERALESSRERAADGELSAAASDAVAAAELMPLDSRPRVQLASLQRLAGDRDAAIETLMRAIELAPQDPRSNALLGLTYLETNDPRFGEQAARVEALTPEGLQDSAPNP